MSFLKHLCGALSAATALLCASAPAQAQTADFPPKQITIVVPFAPGGGTDTIGRAVGAQLAENLKVPVIVENRPGGGAQVAANLLKQAPADGATILLGDIGALALNPHLYPKLNHDPLKDFTPLARLTISPMMLVVPASSPFNTVADLVAALKSRPNGVSFASQGNGTGGHLFAEMLRLKTKGQLSHVPYKGSGPAVQDLIGGQVEAFFDPIFLSGPYVKAGKLKALAIGTAQRSPQFPQVPTLKELGHDDINLVPWFGMVVKAGTPQPVVQRLNAEVVKALLAPAVSKRFTELGQEVAPQSSEEFGAFMRAESVRWGKVIRDAGITLQ